MAVLWREDLKGRWPIVVYADPYTAMEWDRTIAGILTSPAAGLPLKLLVDSRHCTATRDVVARLATFSNRFAARATGGRVAILLDRNRPFDLAGADGFHAQGGSAGLDLQVFDEWTLAERWLERPGSARTATGDARRQARR